MSLGRGWLLGAVAVVLGVAGASAQTPAALVDRAVQAYDDLDFGTSAGLIRRALVVTGQEGLTEQDRLRARGLRVGLLDADIYGPSAPTLFGLHGRPRVREGRILEPLDGFGVKVMSIGFVVDPETALVWRGPMVKSAVAQMLGEVAWGDLDVLVVDLPPGTGDAQLAIAQAVPLSGAVIVSTPQDLALIDARRAIAMFARLGVPILGLVENMSHFVCGTCGTRHAVFGEGGAQAEALRLGLPFLGAVPLVLALREASDAGRPVAALDPDGPVGRIYHGMAEAMASGLDRVQQRSRDPCSMRAPDCISGVDERCEAPQMKTILGATVVAIALAFLASTILNDRFQQTTAQEFTTAFVRLDDPGSNLIDAR